MMSLGQLPATGQCLPANATPDARVVIGSCSTGTSSEAFRWTAATGIHSLGFVPGSISVSAAGVSDDGTVVVGTYYDASYKSQTFRWTQSSGMVGLGLLPGYESSSINVVRPSMSADATVIVGETTNSARTTTPFRWSAESGLVALQPLPGEDDAIVDSVSSDGSVVAGQSGHRGSSGVTWDIANAVVWDAHGAAHSVADDLGRAGVDLQGFHLDYAGTASVEGEMALHGLGKGREGTRAWVAWLP